MLLNPSSDSLLRSQLPASADDVHAKTISSKVMVLIIYGLDSADWKRLFTSSRETLRLVVE